MEMNGDKPVTKKELDASLGLVRKELDESITQVRKDLGEDIAAVRKDLGADIAAVRKDLGADIAAVRKDLGADIAGVRKDLTTLTVEVVNLKVDMKEMKANMSTKQDIERVLAAVANFAGRAEGYDQRETLRSHILDDHGGTLRDHEERITKLETGQAEGTH